MDYNAFKTKLKELVQQILGPEYKVSVETIPKNNGVFRESMVIRHRKEHAVPAVYIQPYYEAFMEGTLMEEAASQVVEEYRAGSTGSSSCLTFFEHYEKVSAHICFRLINYEKNSEMLKNMPYRKILDLALVYYYRIEEFSGRKASILIHNFHIKVWDVTEEELFERARDNTCRLLPPYMAGMLQLIQETAGENFYDGDEENMGKEENMFVLTNQEKYYGAVCFLYPQVLERIGAFLKNNFYILPSSIHESIIVPDSGQFFPDDLKLIVQDVNRQYVAEEEILSDHIYYYDTDNRILKMEK
ncbi:MAG: DUF5688 family protein [Ruminococcus sp.]